MTGLSVCSLATLCWGLKNMRKYKKFIVYRNGKLCSRVMLIRGTYRCINGLPLFDTLDGKLIRPSNYLEGLIDGAQYSALFRPYDGLVLGELGQHDVLESNIKESDIDISSKEDVVNAFSSALAEFVIGHISAIITALIATVLLSKFFSTTPAIEIAALVCGSLSVIANIVHLIHGTKSHRLYDKCNNWVDIRTGVTNLNGFMKREATLYGDAF